MPLMDHLGVSEATMALMLTARGIIVARRYRVAGVAMLGRVMERLKDHFLVLQEALSRGHLALITSIEVDTVVIAVVAVGETATASIRRWLLWNRRRPQRWLLPGRRHNHPVRHGGGDSAGYC